MRLIAGVTRLTEFALTCQLSQHDYDDEPTAVTPVVLTRSSLWEGGKVFHGNYKFADRLDCGIFLGLMPLLLKDLLVNKLPALLDSHFRSLTLQFHQILLIFFATEKKNRKSVKKVIKFVLVVRGYKKNLQKISSPSRPVVIGSVGILLHDSPFARLLSSSHRGRPTLNKLLFSCSLRFGVK